MIFSPLKRMPSLNEIWSRNDQYGLQSMTQADSTLRQVTEKGWPELKSNVPSQCLPLIKFGL